MTLRISLRYIDPPIWRDINVPDSYTLLKLHRCIQLVFAWLDYHLFQFHFGTRHFDRPGSDMDGEDAGDVQLRDLELTVGSTFLYAYDMGDDWEHDVVVRSIESVPSDEELDLCAYLLDGARAAPPEDVGGPPGYARLLRALVQPEDREDHDLIAWAGRDFNPDLFDRRAGNHVLVLASAWGAI